MLVRVLTQYLDPQQYGQLALALTVGALINQVLMGGISAGVGRFYSVASKRNKLPIYLQAFYKIMHYSTVMAVTVSVTIILTLFWLDHSKWAVLFTFTLVASLLNGYVVVIGNILQASRQRAVFALQSSIDAWMRIIMAVGMIHLLDNSVIAVVVGYGISSILVLSLQLFLLRRLVTHRSENSNGSKYWIRKIWLYSWPFSTWGIFTWAQQASDRWALFSFTSTHEVGIYSVLYQLGYTPIILLTGMINSFLWPILYQKLSNDKKGSHTLAVGKIINRITYSYFLMIIIFFLLTFFLHQYIFTVLVESSYHSGSYLLPWLFLAGGIYALGQIQTIRLMSEMRTVKLIAVNIVTAIIGIFSNMYGAYEFGLHGVIVAQVLCACVYFIWMMWLSKQNL